MGCRALFDCFVIIFGYLSEKYCVLKIVIGSCVSKKFTTSCGARGAHWSKYRIFLLVFTWCGNHRTVAE